MTRAQGCFVCGTEFEDRDRLAFMRGRMLEEYCSEVCLRAIVRQRRIERAAITNRWLLRLWLVVLLAAGGSALWQRFHVREPSQAISYEPPDADRPRVKQAKTWKAIEYGPPWPPTDADWMFAFRHASWIYPLPGPARRPPTSDSRIFGPETPRAHPAFCRVEKQCGVDLGGELWGEHVYAVHDGVVDRVRRVGSDESGGQYVRLSHFDGLVFTQYFHLAAIPLGLARGVPIKAGDVIGLVGDTGMERPHKRLHFTLSVQLSSELPEVYWDPMPWMADWPLRQPAHGTVAGFVPANEDQTASRRADNRPTRRRH